MAAMASRVGGPTTRGVQCLSDETFFLSLSFLSFPSRHRCLVDDKVPALVMLSLRLASRSLYKSSVLLSVQSPSRARTTAVMASDSVGDAQPTSEFQERAARMIKSLDPKDYKGNMGKIVVIGGCEEYV